MLDELCAWIRNNYLERFETYFGSFIRNFYIPNSCTWNVVEWCVYMCVYSKHKNWFSVMWKLSWKDVWCIWPGWYFSGKGSITLVVFFTKFIILVMAVQGSHKFGTWINVLKRSTYIYIYAYPSIYLKNRHPLKWRYYVQPFTRRVYVEPTTSCSSHGRSKGCNWIECVIIRKVLLIMSTSALIILKKLKIIFIYFKKLCNKILKVAKDVFH
jgi:hypothetical protein